jgi:hypothetical protein
MPLVGSCWKKTTKIGQGSQLMSQPKLEQRIYETEVISSVTFHDYHHCHHYQSFGGIQQNSCRDTEAQCRTAYRYWNETNRTVTDLTVLHVLNLIKRAERVAQRSYLRNNGPLTWLHVYLALITPLSRLALRHKHVYNRRSSSKLTIYQHFTISLKLDLKFCNIPFN